MFTIKQAAPRIGVSPSKVRQLVSLKLIAHFRVGGKILIAQDDIDAYLARCRVDVAEAPKPKPPPVTLQHIRL